MQYPSDRWIRYTPDMAGRFVTIERLTSAEAYDKTYWSGVQDAPQGVPKQINLGSSLIERWAFSTTRQQPKLQRRLWLRSVQQSLLVRPRRPGHGAHHEAGFDKLVLEQQEPRGARGLVRHSYDGEGRRVKKEDGSVTTRYVYDANGNLVAEYGGTMASSAATHYITTDHLGSTRLVTDNSGNVVSRHDYLPFGEEIFTASRTPALGYQPNPDLSQRFTGKERDAETGLDYFWARYFSGAMGRFASPDWSANPMPGPYADLANPQSLNLYTHGLNAPTRYNDPIGHCVWDACIAETYVVVSAVTVAAATAVAAVQSTPAGRKATDAIADGLSKAVANAQQGLANVIAQNPAGTSLFGQHAYLSKSAQASGGQAQQGQTSSRTSAQSRDENTSSPNGGANQPGGGKTGRKQNEDRADSAKQNLENAKKHLDDLRKQNPRPQGFKSELQKAKAKAQVKHWTKKAAEKSEEHARVHQR